MPAGTGLSTRISSLAVAFVCILAVVLALPAGASANTYCVADAACLSGGGTSEPDVQSALSAAQSNPGPDRVQIGAGTFTAASSAGFTYGSVDTNPVDVVGAGSSQTTLRAPTPAGNGTGTTLSVSAPSSSTISDLAVVVPGATTGNFPYDVGIFAAATVSRVSVTADPTFNGGQGIELTGTLRDSTVDVGTTASGAAAVRVRDTTSGTIQDSTLNGYYGVYADSTTAVATIVNVSRVRITAWGSGIYTQASTVTAEDSLIQMTSQASFTNGVFARTRSTADDTTTLRNDTIIGGANGVQASAPDSGHTATLNLDSSIIQGAGTNSLFRSAASGATANLTASYSNYLANTTEAGTGTLTQSPGDTHFADPGFVSPGTGDYRLRFSTPLRDLGNPATFAGESATDLAGAPRVVDGNGDGIAVRDMGAFEYQPRPPTAVATASPTTVLVGQPVTYDGSGSSDPEPGDTLTFAWAFDDGASATGAVVQHAFATPGQHAATLTVTDTTGQRATTTKSVTVNTAPVLPSPEVLVVVGKETVSPNAFAAAPSGPSAVAGKRKYGAKVTFTLNEAASVRFTVAQPQPGRKAKDGRCVKPTKANRRARKCTRLVTLRGSFTRTGTAGTNSFRFTGRLNGKKLKPGRYQLVATPTANGRSGRSKSAAFRIIE